MFKIKDGSSSSFSSQEAYSALLKVHIAPKLRELGLTGSGNSYFMPNPEHFILIGFQKSRFSDSQNVIFTINISVANKEAWLINRERSSYLPEKPSANTFYGNMIWQARIGNLLPDGNDKWWEITPITGLENLGTEIMDAIRKYVLPAIQQKLL